MMTKKIKITTVRLETLLTCCAPLSEYIVKWEVKALQGIGFNDKTTIQNPYVIALIPDATTWYVLGAHDEGNKIFLFNQESEAKLFLDKLNDLINTKYSFGYNSSSA